MMKIALFSMVAILVVAILSLVGRSIYLRGIADSDVGALPAELGSGNPEAGKVLFFSDEGAGCHICHRIGPRGGNIGPDLSYVGIRRDPPHILESILDPSRQVEMEFQLVEIETQDGLIYRGVKKNETQGEIRLGISSGEVRAIQKDLMIRMESRPESLMPENYAELLTPTQIADLVSYLRFRGME